MINGNYEQILKMISENSQLPIDEIERRIEAKRAKLSGLISKEGAAQIIASELGISFDKQKMKISGLLSGMRRINLVGKIIRLNKVAEYNKNGRSGKIGSFLLADDSGNIRVVLWDVNHIGLIERGEIKDGDVVEISNGDIRNGEMHLSSFGDIKLSNTILENVQTKPTLQSKAIEKMQVNDTVSSRAFVVQIFGPTFYSVCSECNKKVNEMGECEAHGKVIPKKNAILTLIVDDGTSSIRAVLFSEQIKKLTNTAEIPSSEEFMLQRGELIGKELIIEGGVRKNKLSENLEIFVNEVREVDLDKLIEELEKH
jgi:ssDNA-binding replication factor A large subunit